MPIAESVVLEDEVVIHHPQLVNLYGCRIGARSRIGSFVEIQRGAQIGADCKISSHSFLCEGVTLEDGVFIGHGVMFTNDLYPRAVNADGSLQTEVDWQVVTTLVKAQASIGSNATILAGHHDRRRRAGRRRRGGHQRRAGLRHRRRRSGEDHRQHEGRFHRAPGDRSLTPRAIPRIRLEQKEQSMIGMAVVGYGYWGPNLVRNLWETPGAGWCRCAICEPSVSPACVHAIQLSRRRAITRRC